ncbi:MAG: PilZ domain-containing protein [Acidobacteria bacterium]|nr:PilZ domain-containing protein [Acidobacteriota bacterium]
MECRSSGAYTLGRSQDASEGGLSVQTRDIFEPRTEVVVRFNLPPYPPGIPIEAKGEIVHIRSGEMGIQFLSLSDRQRQAIARYVRESLEEDI